MGNDSSLIRQWEPPDGVQVILLPQLFPRNPRCPFLVELESVETLELRCEIGAAGIGAIHPREQFFGTVVCREITHKSSTIQIGVCPNLKIDGLPFRLQSDIIVKIAAVSYHGPEHHLIVAAEGPADPSRHPCFEKHRKAFMKPPR